MRLFVLTLLLAFVAAPAGAQDVQTPQSAPNSLRAVLGCGPSGGMALELDIGWPNNVAKLHIWGEGIREIMAGQKTIVVDNDPGPDGSGQSEVCSVSNGGRLCHHSNVSLTFKTLELKPGGQIDGTLNMVRGGKIPFTGAILAQQVTCH